ncbi:hypothetical protein HK097_002207 [Rhizophlyctis rosea]|uniref:Uncharacterized protein n=1 Tax=Rhizophlyctis rosea TaxID=64517 RepID=A0AAD5SGI7_9FUNG|nr:hypothetical protein HK097_002207 [Rhizophlyctis rosea]
MNFHRAYQKFYECHDGIIIVLSPDVFKSSKWKNVFDYPSVLAGSKANNQVIEGIVEDQIEKWDDKKPRQKRCLLVIDDFSGGDLIFACHNRTLLEGSQINNVLQWCVWDMTKKNLKKFCDDTATAKMDEVELFKFIKANIHEPYSFVDIDFNKPPDETFWIGFDRPYLRTQQ